MLRNYDSCFIIYNNYPGIVNVAKEMLAIDCMSVAARVRVYFCV